jgi:signal transduction histidine kinase
MVPLLGMAGYYLFSQFSNQLNRRMDEELVNDEIHWISYLEKQAASGTTFILRTPELLIYPVNDPATRFPQISDRHTNDESGNNRFPFRVLTHVVSIDGINYYISISRSQEQKTLLVANITRMMLIVFLGLFVFTMIFNWIISKRLWKPFRRSLEKIRRAELQKIEKIRFEETDIYEFNELNTSLNTLTNKIHEDYVTMKEFTENAAHEMQTPLAVMQSKIELLMQDSNLTHEQVQSLMQAETALKQLSKLNQSLLLLAKIENHQYDSNETINLADVVEKYLKLFEDIIGDKQLSVENLVHIRF